MNTARLHVFPSDATAQAPHGRKAVFLDRDGTLVAERGLVTTPEQLELLAETPRALTLLRDAGFLLLLTTNQTVVARGLISVGQLQAIHEALQTQLIDAGSPPLDGIYCCLHHPQADVPQYRSDCPCRKPRSGLLEQAALEWQVDLAASFMVGDRPTDIAAGRRVGCRGVLITSFATDAPPIVTTDDYAAFATADFCSSDLLTAARWICATSACSAESRA